jgi:hypothetical protein
MAKLSFDEATEVLGYGQWNTENPQMGEWVRVKFDGDSQTRRYTLDKSVNGDRPMAGTLVTLRCESVQRHDAKIGRDGHAYVSTREQIRVVALAPVA